MIIETKTVHFVDYGDLQDEVKKRYDIDDYEFVAVQECGNDCEFEFKVDKALTDFEKNWDLPAIEKMKTDKYVETFNNGLVFKALCLDGFIEPGTYIVRVSW